MKRQCVEEGGLIEEGSGFTQFCKALALKGWIHGWYYPFIFQEHMDDPRAPHTLLKTNVDLQKHLPLSARNSNVRTLEAWQAQLRNSARIAQTASIDPRDYRGWRQLLRRINLRLHSYYRKSPLSRR